MRRVLLFMLLILFLCGNIYAGWLDKGTELFNQLKSKNNKSNNQLSISEIAAGLKDALKVGTENVVSQLGRVNGFYRDKNIHIPLPKNLQKIKKILKGVGLSKELDNLELKLNRAAELATPKAKKLFWEAISKMTIKDVKKIYNGPKDAATQYFKNKMSIPLKNEMRPIVSKTLNQVKAVQTYNSILKKYNSLPFVKHVHGDISDYVLKKALDGIFYYLAKEEAAIRENPAKRTTEILKKVFGYK